MQTRKCSKTLYAKWIYSNATKKFSGRVLYGKGSDLSMKYLTLDVRLQKSDGNQAKRAMQMRCKCNAKAMQKHKIMMQMQCKPNANAMQ